MTLQFEVRMCGDFQQIFTVDEEYNKWSNDGSGDLQEPCIRKINMSAKLNKNLICCVDFIEKTMYSSMVFSTHETLRGTHKHIELVFVFRPKLT